MKKAYNPDWVSNLYIREKAAYWKRKNLITSEQEENVSAKFPMQFYMPGIFVKIGLFIFALIACSFFVGFLALFFPDLSSEASFSAMSIVCCGFFLFFLEYLIKNRNLFHSGIDNALLYAAFVAAMVPVFSLADAAGIWFYCLAVLAFLIPATLRYADLLTAAGSVITVFILLGSLLVKSEIGKMLLPFAMMALSAVIYWWSKKEKNLYYQNCAEIARFLGLVMFYLSGNYMIVREGNAMLLDLPGFPSPQIALSQVFYLFTTIIPIGYIAYSLRTHDRTLLWTGLATLAFSIYTYEHYFGILTVAQELTVIGVALITFAWLAIRYFHIPRHCISDESAGDEKLAGLEVLAVAQLVPEQAPESGFKFGGGHFGGGGAGEVY